MHECGGTLERLKAMRARGSAVRQVALRHDAASMSSRSGRRRMCASPL
jgi:hypothetical protein